MKFAAICILLWMAHITLNAMGEYVPRRIGDLEKRNACIDLFDKANSWKQTLCSKDSPK